MAIPELISSQISLSWGSNSSHARKYFKIMLIRADGGIADKHILKADRLIYPSCYWRSLINLNVWLSFVNIVPFLCLFFYVTVWRDVSNVDFVQMLQSSEFFGLLCLDDLCRYSIMPFSLSFVLHLQKRKNARIAVGSSPPPDLNPIMPSTLYIKYIKFV